jgi:uncharacterized protein
VKLLIDGYNLMQAAGQFGTAAGAGTLESARLALLDFLVASLTPADAKRTVVVFDAAAAPPGRPATIDYEGITVRFSRRKGSADDLIEELVDAAEDPRHLTVVSSDHRVQRAARRRRATPIDSEAWYRGLRSQSQPSTAGTSDSAGKPADASKPAADLGNPFPADYLKQVERELDEL